MTEEEFERLATKLHPDAREHNAKSLCFLLAEARRARESEMDLAAVIRKQGVAGMEQNAAKDAEIATLRSAWKLDLRRVNMEQLRADAAEAERDEIAERFSEVLMHVTDGRMSKTNYTTEAMKALIDDWFTKTVEDEVAEVKREADAERDRLREALEKIANFEHSDTCQYVLISPEGTYPCRCHKGIARAALAGGGKEKT